MPLSDSSYLLLLSPNLTRKSPQFRKDKWHRQADIFNATVTYTEFLSDTENIVIHQPSDPVSMTPLLWQTGTCMKAVMWVLRIPVAKSGLSSWQLSSRQNLNVCSKENRGACSVLGQANVYQNRHGWINLGENPLRVYHTCRIVFPILYLLASEPYFLSLETSLSQWAFGKLRMPPPDLLALKEDIAAPICSFLSGILIGSPA